jgi:two-component system sensor histidine kinase YesM
MKDPLSLWLIVKNYRFQSVFIKNFFIILALILLPITGLSVGIYNLYSKTVTDEIASAHLNALATIRDMVDMLVREVDDFSLRLASDESLIRLLASDQPAPIDYNMNYTIDKIYDELHTSNNIRSFVDSVYVYSNKHRYVLSSRLGRWPLEQFPDHDWLDDYNERIRTSNDWVMARKAKLLLGSSEKRQLITFVREAPLFGTPKTGSVMINIDTARFMNTINNADNDYIDHLYVIDGDGTVLGSEDFNWINHHISEIIPYDDVMSGKPSEPAFLYNDNTKQSVSHINSLYNDWKFISVVPLRLYEDKAKYIRNYLFVSSLFSIVVSLILSLVISWKMFMPIKQIMSVVSSPGEWLERPDRRRSKARLNEIKYITTNILNSYGEKRELENELRRRLELLEKANAIALQSQINPHFLYNTLETINWQALRLSGGENPVSEMIASLSQLLRYALDGDETVVTIRREIAHCKHYIDIQKKRYPRKIEVEWSIDDAIMECKIPRITLQPLIENAIYHGIKPKSDKGTIIVSGSLEGDRAVIRIADDGVGIDPVALAQINAELARKNWITGSHIGVQNVNQRIKLTFGEAYGLHVASEPGKGTIVTVSISALRV